MEGSRNARAKDTHPDTGDVLRRGGLPAKPAAMWAKAVPRVTGALKRDTTAAVKFWRGSQGLLAKLPAKPQRTLAQQAAVDVIFSACRGVREQFLKSTPE